MNIKKILLCGMLLLGSGAMLTGCGKDPKDPTPSDPSTELQTMKIVRFVDYNVEYNGNYQILEPKCDVANFNFLYSADGVKYYDKNRLPKLDNPNTDDREFKDAGRYLVYLKITKEGYKTITTSTTMVINEKEVEVSLSDASGFVSDAETAEEILSRVTYGQPGENRIVAGDTLKYEIEMGNLLDSASAEPIKYNPNDLRSGQVYEILGVDTDPNYAITFNSSKYHVKDNIEIVRNGSPIYFNSLATAVSAVREGETIRLLKDVISSRTVSIDKSITIDGQGKYKITASKAFTALTDFDSKKTASIINIKPENDDVQINLKNITLDCASNARGISAFSGKVVLDNVKIINGKKVDNRRSGGVFISHNASFVMNSGEIVGNNANDTQYTLMCSDLWIGANAEGALVSINGGKIGNAFINSNEFSANNPGMFTLNGGEIKNVYVEYDAGYGAQFKYEDGTVKTLYVASTTEYGKASQLSLVKGTVYRGGVDSYTDVDKLATAYVGKVFNSNIDEIIANGESYLFANCVFNSAIVSDKTFVVAFEGCTFNSASLNTGDYTAIKLTNVNSLIINNCLFGGNLTVGSAATTGRILDLALAKNAELIKITNSTFKPVSSQHDIAIKLTTAEDVKVEEMLVKGNTFDSTVNEIVFGESSQTDTENTESFNVNLTITKNKSKLNIRECFIETEESTSVYTSVEVNATYSHTAQQEEQE